MKSENSPLEPYDAVARKYIYGAIVLLYFFSLTLPVFLGGDEINEGLRTMKGWQVLALGWYGIYIGQYSWYANILALLALVIKRHRIRTRIILASAALLLGLQTIFFNHFASLFGFFYVFGDTWRWGPGYYVWVSTLVLIAAAVVFDSLYVHSGLPVEKEKRVRMSSPLTNDVQALLKVVGISLGVFVGFIVLVGAGSVVENNWQARAMEKWVETIEHPTLSSHVKSMWMVANFGMSNHCDWAGGEIRTSTLSRKEIEDFYEPRVIASYKTPEVSFEVYFPDAETHSSEIDHFIDELKRISLQTPGKNTYLILAIDAMHPAGEDIRCH